MAIETHGIAAPDDDSHLAASIGEVLYALTESLDLPEELKPHAERIQKRFQSPVSPDAVPHAVAAIAGLVSKMRTVLQTERAEMQSFLQSLTHQLHEIDSFTMRSDRASAANREARLELRASVSDAVRSMHRDVNAATSLEALKSAVKDRVTAIDARIETYLQTGDQRNREAAMEIRQLAERLRQTERETERLRTVLEETRSKALRDALTGLYNRAAFEERIAEEHARWSRYHQPLTLLIWDVDQFKRINDQYGHQAGDEVLRTVAELLDQGTRKSDFLARYGGEEFVQLLPATEEDNALLVAEKLRRSIEDAQIAYKEHQISVSASCGIAMFAKGDTPESVLRRADVALYEAKESGRNRCIVANPSGFEQYLKLED